MLSVKVIFISTSVLSMAVMLMLSDLPSVWIFLNSLLRPPYLYLIINCIIITIVASSRLQSNKVDFDHPLLPPEETAPVMLQPEEPVKLIPRAHVPMDYAVVVYDSVVPTVEVKPEIESEYGVQVPEPDLYVVTEDASPVPETIAVNALEDKKIVNEIMFSKPVRSVPKNDLTMIKREKPPVSARFGHRKSIKASPEGGRKLGVTKPKRQDTLESTWKTITEGRPMPLTRHLKKSDTWETQGRHLTPTATQMIISETINVSNLPPPPLSHSTGSGKLKKDPSLGQEELNKRIEAFIKKSHEVMRLQRQESLKQYMGMINRVAH